MQVRLVTDAAAFGKAVAALQQAIASGDLAAARKAYPEATAAYARIEPAARRFADLGASIDGTAAYLAGREADPAFTGLHRIEYGLFSKKRLDGLGPVAERLATDAATLRQRLATRTPQPAALAGDAADWLAAAGETLRAGGKEAYAGNDLGDLGAGLDTVRRSIGLTAPLARKVAAAESATVEAAWTALSGRLAALQGPGGFPALSDVPAETRAALAHDLTALGEALATLNEKIEAAS
jgi:iron uptake system component EfeO